MCVWHLHIVSLTDERSHLQYINQSLNSKYARAHVMCMNADIGAGMPLALSTSCKDGKSLLTRVIVVCLVACCFLLDPKLAILI